MISAEKIKLLSKLSLKKYRSKENKFLIEGKRLIDEAVKSAEPIELILYTQEFFEKDNDFISFLLKKGLNLSKITKPQLKKISQTENSQGIIAVLNIEKKKIKENSKLIIALENISDPGNMGTILRSCEWFNFKDIIVSPGCVDIYNPKVLRSSMGSIFNLNIEIDDDFYQRLELLANKGYQMLIADMNGENLYEADINKKSILVLSNEANGPTEQLLKLTHRKINIPKYGKVESLNVAMAGSIIISELRRKLSL